MLTFVYFYITDGKWSISTYVTHQTAYTNVLRSVILQGNRCAQKNLPPGNLIIRQLHKNKRKLLINATIQRKRCYFVVSEIERWEGNFILLYNYIGD